MAHKFKKHLDKKWIFILSIAIFAAIGILAFVLAYGFTDGWAAVAAWFRSKYAILLYMCIGTFGIITLLLWVWERYKRI